MRMVHRVVLLATILALTVNAGLLALLGIPYAADGGSPAIKLHPAGIACVLAVMLEIIYAGSEAWMLLYSIGQERMLAAFMGCVALCLVSEAIMTGRSNLAVLLDTYVPAGCLAIALRNANDTERSHVRNVLQTCFAANAIIGLAEGLCSTDLLPPNQDNPLYKSDPAEFRPCALYDHPLTGAAMSLIGAFIPPSRSSGFLCRYGYLVLLGLGLIAFGGRAAMATGILCLVLLALSRFWRSVLRRQCSLRLLAVFGCVTLMVGCAGVAVFGLGVGQRLGAHLYWDPSAQVRVNQWQVLGLIDAQQMAFGVSRHDLMALLEPMRLSHGVPVIENFWLLMFLNLGLSAFPLFVAGFACLLVWCVRQADGRAMPLVLATLATASASNSLGRKSALLLVLVAAACSMVGQHPRRGSSGAGTISRRMA